MLKIENLSVNYGYVNALRGINFEVNKGEIITLIGANGAGKTTTLRSISNLIKKEQGKIVFKDKDITNLATHKIVEMGMCHVPEGRLIFKDLTFMQNIISGSFGNKNIKKDRKEEL